MGIPDYIIYDEIKKEREEQRRKERPRIRVPQEPPPGYGREDEQHEEKDDVDRGVTTFQM